MAEDGDTASQAEERAAEFDMEFAPRIPGGRAIFPAEREGKFVFLVATGAMTQQCFDEMLRHLQAIVGAGQWSQNWSDGDTPADQDPAAAHRDESLFDMEWRPTLPDGAAILPDEEKGRFVWLVRKGAMTRQCFEEMRAYLLHIVSSGQWSQNWGGSPQPGH
ncbi:hypothetical protein [Streptomyces sp. bgisy031]|uniref:hypothetical protein n=1 Tax=Streptomyces sp. bgisy031 TaxID=3413772 RepID=UPI003D70E124